MDRHGKESRNTSSEDQDGHYEQNAGAQQSDCASVVEAILQALIAIAEFGGDARDSLCIWKGYLGPWMAVK